MINKAEIKEKSKKEMQKNEKNKNMCKKNKIIGGNNG